MPKSQDDLPTDEAKFTYKSIVVWLLDAKIGGIPIASFHIKTQYHKQETYVFILIEIPNHPSKVFPKRFLSFSNQIRCKKKYKSKHQFPF